MAEAKRDGNYVPTLLAVSSTDGVTPVTLYADPTTHRLYVDLPAGGGTVTSVSVVSANGFAGTVATATTTPAITLTTSITGVLKGNGTAISAATSGTDYAPGTSALATGILKSTTTTGALSIAVAGDFPTLNQNTTGSAASLSISGQTGLLTFTGITSTNRAKTVRDAADTILELGGSYTPTGTWTSMTLVTPALGTPASGTLTNCTGLPVAGITASTSTALGVGSIELGNASDTTLSRGSAGVLAVEGKTVATLSTAQTWTANQTQQQELFTINAITASGNAATVPVTYRLHNVTNNSAATLTITLTTASAVDGQMVMIRVYDFSAVAQTITWVNTENSTVSAPTTSNGSTTLPVTVGFQYNSATSKWRCIASA